MEQGTYILKAAGIVLTLVLPIGAAILKGAAKLVAVFVIIRVIKDIGAIAVEDTPRANTLPRLEVAAGIETALVAASALVAVEEATPLVAIAPLAEPRVPTLAPILVIEAQSLLREVLISATCQVLIELPGFGNW